ncbi:hypothetical protein P7K49_036893, partial [Saguinus oedipus]
MLHWGPGDRTTKLAPAARGPDSARCAPTGGAGPVTGRGGAGAQPHSGSPIRGLLATVVSAPRRTRIAPPRSYRLAQAVFRSGRTLAVAGKRRPWHHLWDVEGPEKLVRPLLATCGAMDVAEVEFLAEKELVTIIPNFSLDKIYLIGVRGPGSPWDAGRARPGLPRGFLSSGRGLALLRFLRKPPLGAAHAHRLRRFANEENEA